MITKCCPEDMASSANWEFPSCSAPSFLAVSWTLSSLSLSSSALQGSSTSDQPSEREREREKFAASIFPIPLSWYRCCCPVLLVLFLAAGRMACRQAGRDWSGSSAIGARENCFFFLDACWPVSLANAEIMTMGGFSWGIAQLLFCPTYFLVPELEQRSTWTLKISTTTLYKVENILTSIQQNTTIQLKPIRCPTCYITCWRCPTLSSPSSAHLIFQ